MCTCSGCLLSALHFQLETLKCPQIALLCVYSSFCYWSQTRCGTSGTGQSCLLQISMAECSCLQNFATPNSYFLIMSSFSAAHALTTQQRTHTYVCSGPRSSAESCCSCVCTALLTCNQAVLPEEGDVFCEGLLLLPQTRRQPVWWCM